MKDRILIIKRDVNSFEKFYNDKFREVGILCFDPYKKMGKIGDFICHISMHFNLPFHSLFYGGWKKEVRNSDMVIIFDWIYSHNIIKDIESINPNCKVVFWFWNRIEQSMKKKIICSKIDTYWSFDPKDAKIFNLHLYSQFYAASEYKLEKNNRMVNNFSYDIFFCGTDKGRLEQLEILKQYFDSENINYKLIVKKDKGTKNEYHGIEMVRTQVDYGKIISYIKETKCILDLTNQFQEGLTIRSLEALFFSKLLITDNKYIKNVQFYNPKYIYIMGEDKRTIKEFLREDLPFYKNDQKKYYCIEEWVKRFNE